MAFRADLGALRMLDIAASDSRPAKLRSRFTNDPSFLPGVDRRTRDGRRYQDIVLALVAEFSPANPVALREIATLRFSLERAQGEIVAGGDCSLEDIVRLTNAIERKERALRASKHAAIKAQSVSLEQHLARRSVEKAGGG